MNFFTHKKLLFLGLLGALFIPNITFATISSVTDISVGDFIKREGSTAVYRIIENQEKQYFSAEWIFKCYESDYSKVKIFPSNLDLDQFYPTARIGAVPPKPNCGLAKSPVSPSVYAFDTKGVRHKIKDETTATLLYGKNWAQKVHDMPDFLISLFPLGIVFDQATLIDNTREPQIVEDIWKPAPGTTWQWQLDTVPQGDFENVAVYDIDLFEATSADVKRLHDAGKKVICYVNVGAYEEWREDADQFPEEILGNEYDGWEGERWLDIRAKEKLYPLLEKRMDECAEKGFDGLEPDNIDGYQNDTGFPLTASDQLTFNKWLAKEAHERGLSIALKNDPDQIEELQPYFDYAITEDCVPDKWCDDAEVFNHHNKAVFMTEYTDNNINFQSVCSDAKENRFSFILKNRDLDEFVQICR